MALEAVVYPKDPFSYGCKDFYYFGGGGAGGVWGYENLALQEDDAAFLGVSHHNIVNIKEGVHEHANLDSSSPSLMQNVKEYYWDPNSSNSPETCTIDQSFARVTPGATTARRKRRRTKSSKNEVEIENQRMTHIAVERNRRKQMNEYLALLRSLMPPSYVQRSDQASIVGGAINFVKELEQLLQSMEAYKRRKQEQESQSSPPFSQFFIFPQYSTGTTRHCNKSSATDHQNESMAQNINDHQYCAAVADIEVNMVESHANLKILSKKVHPRQLWKMVSGFQILRLTVLHLNVVTSTADQMVLYSFSVKVEEGCQMNTVDEIAAAVNQMLRRIQEEAAFI
ncbi:transcription factor bHLH96-like [Juglans microcarpa x Juglans regia]|uniref:transcription factor bHLH96-like n=1 Tax=Juglans microcarpa x Juglans regia TaxID=2249226 RepID=UPI001B7ECB93|nr:transcription factor bHLH96-like [Juglans microcarpa x Juglans regia]